MLTEAVRLNCQAIAAAEATKGPGLCLQTAVLLHAPPNVQKNGRANAQSVVNLMYGEGTAVDQSNRTEVETFQSYLAAKQAAPDSKETLLAYYRQVAG